jgi:hypothetical protein
VDVLLAVNLGEDSSEDSSIFSSHSSSLRDVLEIGKDRSQSLRSGRCRGGGTNRKGGVSRVS